MDDVLLHRFFEKSRWEAAIQTAVEKGIDRSLLRDMSSPETRLRIYRAIRDGEYVIAPPHEAQIPKDDGTMRTVYVNEGMDRVLLSIANDMLFELCPELVHPRCGSYQKGIGCGKLVKEMSAHIAAIGQDDMGVKVDLSKYFDSVPRNYIDEVFDYVEAKFGPSALIRTIRTYYHTDTVVDMSKRVVEKYSSLRQGCAVAAFLADAVLYDVDEAVSSMGVEYVRYSDDILIVGDGWEEAFRVLSDMLAAKSLVLNPKKVEYLVRGRWFTFLGFMLKDGMISLSPGRVKAYQAEIEKRTIRKPARPVARVADDVKAYLYRGNGRYSWATSVLPIVNVERDVKMLNAFAMDAIRAGSLGRTRIGGLGTSRTGTDGAITRGTGRNVRSNRERIPKIEGWLTLTCMRNAMMTSMEAYRTLAATA